MYELQHHKSLRLEKWARYSGGHQILMTANELNRAGNLIGKGMQSEVKTCYERAMELTDLTSADTKWSGRLKELRRFREVLASLYSDPTEDADLNRCLYDNLIKMEVEAYNIIG